MTWPQNIIGDTNYFLRSNSKVITNSTSPLKHNYQLNFINSQNSSCEIGIKINSDINLSSSNFFEIGLLDSSNNKLSLKIGNTADQCELFWNDTLFYHGPNKEFDVSRFSYQFTIQYFYDKIVLKKINNLNFLASFDTIFTIKKLSQTIGYLKVQQFGTTSISKLNYQYLYFGKINIDTTKPQIIQLKQINNQTIIAEFDRPISNISKVFSSLIPVDSVIKTANPTQFEIKIKLPKFFYSKTQFEFTTVSDLYSNRNTNLQASCQLIYMDTPHYGDLILSEIMVNPKPTLGVLPEKKYLEFYNQSEKHFNANTLIISDRKSQVQLPNMIIQPKSYILFVNEIDKDYFDKSNCIPIKNFPSFNLDNDVIALKNTQKESLVYFEYFKTMHGSNQIQGGYSLEKQNIASGLLETNNWQSNNNTGGTPGFENSLNTYNDTFDHFKVVESYFYEDTLYVLCNQTLPVNSMASIMVVESGDSLKLNMNENLAKGYFKTPAKNKITIKPLDLKNALNVKTTNFFCSYKKTKEAKGVKFNEILFHNFEGKEDFIELINTDTTANFLSNLSLFVFDETRSILKSITPLLNKSRNTIQPNEIIAFTAYSNSLHEQFKQNSMNQLIEIPNFPNFSAQNGLIKLYNVSLNNFCDSMKFNEQFHSPVISQTIGVSLEKYTPEIESFDSQNWQSALSTVGNATPGNKNSILIEKANIVLNKDRHFKINNKRIYQITNQINPIQIDFQFNRPGYICNVIIFNKFGQLLTESIKNQRLPQKGTLEIYPFANQTSLPSENYVLKLEAFLPNADICREIHRFTVINN